MGFEVSLKLTQVKYYKNYQLLFRLLANIKIIFLHLFSYYTIFPLKSVSIW